MENIDKINQQLDSAIWISCNTIAARILRREMTKTAELPIVETPSDLCR